jgi:hypothetical protein
MIAIARPVHEKNSIPAWCEGFLTMLPAIRRKAAWMFRSLSPDAREEAVAECIATALVAYVALVERGKADLAYPTVLAQYAAAQVRRGRHVGTRLNSRDVLAKLAQRRHGFAVKHLDRFDNDSGQWIEATVEDARTPVPDQAAFRIDFPAWLAVQTLRKRRVAETLAMGHSTRETAERFKISAGRVSQLRRELYDSWRVFHGERMGEDPLATS